MLGGRPDTANPLPHSLHNLSDRRQDTEHRERTSIDQDRVVHEHLKLAVAAVHHLDISMELFPNPRRHPDGMEAGDSVGAESDRNSGHCSLSCRSA